MQDALKKVAGVSEIVSVSHTDSKAVVKAEKGKIDAATLVKAVETDTTFSAKVIE